MKKSVLRTCSLIFGIVCLLAFMDILCTAILLPYEETYFVGNTIYTEYYSWSFDTTYLSSVILTAFGAFWGFVLHSSIPGEKSKKQKKTKKGENREELKSIDILGDETQN